MSVDSGPTSRASLPHVVAGARSTRPTTIRQYAKVVALERMATNTVCLTDLLAHNRVGASPQIFTDRDWLDVQRIRAGWALAQVIEDQAVRDRADQRQVRESIGSHDLPMPTERSMSGTLTCPNPDPAFVFNPNLQPEPVG